MRVSLLALLVFAVACGEPQRIGTDVRFACERPTLDTTDWRRVAGPFPGSTVLAPPGMTASPQGEDVLLRDPGRAVRLLRRPWGDARFHDAAARRADYSSCWTRVGGIRTYVVVRRMEGGYQVTGWYRRPAALPADAGGLDGIVSGASRDSADQTVFLQMIRSLELDR